MTPRETPYPPQEPASDWIDGDRLYREMVSSVNRMLAAEAVFDELREMYRTHRQYAHLDEASQDQRHTADARTKQAISQCQYFRDRAGMFAAAYQAWQVHEQRTNADRGW